MKKRLSHTDPLRQSVSAARDGITDGFTLIELSIVMTVLALVMSSTLSAFTTFQSYEPTQTTQTKLNKINDAINNYIIKNGRLPCVAPRQVKYTAPEFGLAVHNNSCVGQADNAPSYESICPAGLCVWIGAVPVKDLKITADNAYDGWNNQFTYIVTETDTDPVTFGVNKVIELVDISGATNNLSYLIVSHGKDSKGAFMYKSGAKKRPCPIGASLPKDEENCNSDITFQTQLITDGPTPADLFDDILIWRTE